MTHRLPTEYIDITHGTQLPDDYTGVAFNSTIGDFCWYVKGCLHRQDGPAIIYKGHKNELWFNHGVVHRVGGPAVTYSDGVTVEWIINGDFLSEKEYWNHPLNLQFKLKAVVEFEP